VNLISFGTNVEVLTTHMPGKKARIPGLDADRIMERLWQGSVPPQGDALRKLGFDVLVLAAAERQIPARAFPGVQVIHIPLDDARHVPAREASNVARMVARLWRRGARILITCNMGLNRSGLISALAVRLIIGKSGAEAVADVQRARKGALFNDHFRRYLERLPIERRA